MCGGVWVSEEKILNKSERESKEKEKIKNEGEETAVEKAKVKT